MKTYLNEGVCDSFCAFQRLKSISNFTFSLSSLFLTLFSPLYHVFVSSFTLYSLTPFYILIFCFIFLYPLSCTSNLCK
jgi:hypothetical protein